MSEKMVYKCDRCERESTDNRLWSKITLADHVYRDLCDRCRTAFRAFMRGDAIASLEQERQEEMNGTKDEAAKAVRS